MSAHIESVAASVVPKESSLRSALEKIPDGVPSPYVHKSGFSTGWRVRKIGAMALVLFVLIGGGALYAHQSGTASMPTTPASIAVAPDDATLATSPTDTSDTAIDSDVNTIDAQMQALDTDAGAAQTDHSFR